MRGNIDQGLERSPHVRPPISDPSSQTPHLRSGFGTFSPSQAPHFKPPISDSPSQAPISSHHLRPSTSDPPPQTPRFSCETTISGPEHDTYNLRPHAFRVRLQYQAPTMSVITFFVQDYNIRLRTWHLQSQTPRFSCATTTMIRNPRTFAKDSFFSQPRTFMNRHTRRLKGFIYLIKERRNVKLHFKISVNDICLRGINW